MKILIVSKCPTHPTTAGNRRFILNQTQLLKQLGHEVHFLYIQEKAFHDKTSNDDSISLMREFWENNFHLYNVSIREKLNTVFISKYRNLLCDGYEFCDDEYPNGVTKFVNDLNQRYCYDCCLVNYYTMSKLLIKTNIPLKGLITHDYFSFKNILIGEKKSWMGTSANQEAKALQRSPHIFALNTEEAIFFNKLSPKSYVYTIFNYYNYHKSSIVGNKTLLFLSGKNKFNINGLKWFINDILPLLKSYYPDLTLKIGGGICSMLKEYSTNPNIKLLGYINDELEFYNSADIVINPTYEGTGLKIKTFEGISYDKVVMCHPHSSIGIFDFNNAPIFTSNTATDWLNFLNKIWSDESYISEIKENNRKYITNMNNHIISEYERFFNSYVK